MFKNLWVKRVNHMVKNSYGDKGEIPMLWSDIKTCLSMKDTSKLTPYQVCCVNDIKYYAKSLWDYNPKGYVSELENILTCIKKDREKK